MTGVGMSVRVCFQKKHSVINLWKRSLSTPALRDPVIGIIVGSSREESINAKLGTYAGKLMNEMGLNVNHISLDGLPLYSQDIEAKGFPSEAAHLKKQMEACDGWLIAGPEYNGMPTPLFINAITWASRGDPEGVAYGTFKGKVAAVVSASPGALGGLRSLRSYKELLTNLGVVVAPASAAVGTAFKAFDENGSLKDKHADSLLKMSIEQLVRTSRHEANRDVACKILDSLKVKGFLPGEYGTVPPGSS